MPQARRRAAARRPGRGPPTESHKPPGAERGAFAHATPAACFFLTSLWSFRKERKSKSKSARRSRRESHERENLFQSVGAIEGVALGGDVAGVGDDAAEL